MSVTTATLILLGLLVTLLVARRMKKSPADPTTRKSVGTNHREYHSVSIKLGHNACDAARKIAGERLLPGDAPQLPLPDCTGTECNCCFVHHADRRVPADRRSPFNAGVSVNSGTFRKEQRESRDDRRDDSRDDDLF